MIERHPNASPAQKRIRFLYRKIRQCFVAADIQRTHGDGRRMESLQLLAIKLSLLLFTGKAVAKQKTHFSAIKPHTIGTKFLRPLHISRDACISPERDHLAVCGGSRLSRKRRQLLQ